MSVSAPRGRTSASSVNLSRLGYRPKAGPTLLSVPQHPCCSLLHAMVCAAHLGLLEFFHPENTCCISPVCCSEGALRDRLEANLQVLDKCTLAELVASRM